MSQKDITLRQGHATPKTIILRALEAAPASPTTTIYLYEFHATPNTVILGDPTQVRETGGAATYEFTGSVALALGVASPVVAVYAEPAAVALTFGVASPEAVTYTNPAEVALAFDVAAGVAAVFVEPSEDALSFGVESPYQFVPTTSEVPISGGERVTLRWKPKPRVYEFEGRVSLRLGARATITVTSVPPVSIAMPRFRPRSPRTFINVPPPLEPLSEADQLVLAGVL